MDIISEPKETLNIEVFATLNFIHKIDEELFPNRYGDYVVLIASARIIGLGYHKSHAFESKPLELSKLTSQEWGSFKFRVEEWCKSNKDKFVDICKIPPHITI